MKILAFQVGSNLENHLVQTFLAKEPSPDGPVPCPGESKSFQCWGIHDFAGEII